MSVFRPVIINMEHLMSGLREIIVYTYITFMCDINYI